MLFSFPLSLRLSRVKCQVKKLSTYLPKYAQVQNCFPLHFQFINSKGGGGGKSLGDGESGLHPELRKTSWQTCVAQVQNLPKTLASARGSRHTPRASGTLSLHPGHLSKRTGNSEASVVPLPSCSLSGVLGKAARSALGANEDRSISAQPL